MKPTWRRHFRLPALRLRSVENPHFSRKERARNGAPSVLVMPARSKGRGTRQTREHPLSRRGRSLCGKDPGKVPAIVEEQHKPEHRHDQRAPDAFVIEQQMVEQNIYDYRAKKIGRA